mmetsp:Transcript_20434/g.59221  ORF Transcript_20434/g.59221 Transcript_20434/m.59221 type:complete len:344 (-) Transcript_20434:403-1434(-)
MAEVAPQCSDVEMPTMPPEGGQFGAMSRRATAMISTFSCSVGMLLLNKLAVRAFPAVCTLLMLQMAASTVLLLLLSWRWLRIGSWHDVCRWFPVVPVFICQMLTSLLALKHASMSLVVAFRGMEPLFALAVECQLSKGAIAISSKMIFAMLGMLLGIGIYCVDMQWSEAHGVVAVRVNMALSIVSRLVQRYLLAAEHNPVDMCLASTTIVNNALSTILLVPAIYATGEFREIPALLASLDRDGELAVSASCVLTCGISLSGVWLQSLISATSVLVMKNAARFIIVLLEIFFLPSGQGLSHRQFIGVCITIIAGMLYGMARREIEHLSMQTSKHTLLPRAQSGL